MGTQKVEEVLAKVFPKAKFARIDADAMRRKNALRDTLAAFKAHKIDILIGTPGRLIEHANASNLLLDEVEVLVLDVILVVLLTVSLRMVFEPLEQLRDALFGLASMSALSAVLTDTIVYLTTGTATLPATGTLVVDVYCNKP